MAAFSVTPYRGHYGGRRPESQISHDSKSRSRRFHVPTATTSTPQSPLPASDVETTSRYERNAAKYWERFYNRHHNKANGDFKPERLNTFLCDVTVDDLRKEISMSSVDVVTLVFMLSAISPNKMHAVLENIRSILKPNGYVLLRDYATGDFAQEKLADKSLMLSENFYVRGDGTCAFYFSEESLSELFKKCGFCAKDISIYSKQIENRRRKVIMERRWIRGVFCRSDEFQLQNYS